PFAAAEETPCVKCEAALETVGLPPFCEIQCPACDAVNTVPAQFGKFLLRKRLGEGGMGSVYLARDTALGRDIAIKMLQKSLASDPAALASLQTEAANAAKLNHPNVAQIYSFGNENGAPYVEMEFVPGQSLHKFVEQGVKLDPAFVMRAGFEIAEGLKAAETAGLFHGDIKPENILFDAEMKAKLVDFGIASMKSQGGGDELWGTPYYIAPEKVQKKKNSARSDIYSLGATLYHAIAGEPPYEGEDAAAVIRARFKGPPRPLEELRPDIEPEVSRIIGRMMYNDLFMRYPNYTSVVNDIKNYLAPIPAIRKQGPAKVALARAKTGVLEAGAETGAQEPGGANRSAGEPAPASAKVGKKFVIQKGAMEAQIAMVQATAGSPAAMANPSVPLRAMPQNNGGGGGANGAKIALIVGGIAILLGIVGAVVWVGRGLIGSKEAERAHAMAIAQAREIEEKFTELAGTIRSAADFIKLRDNEIPREIEALGAVYLEATGKRMTVPDFDPPEQMFVATDEEGSAPNTPDDEGEGGARSPNAPEPEPIFTAETPAHPLDKKADEYVFAHAKTIRAALRQAEEIANRQPEPFEDIKPAQINSALAKREAWLERREMEVATLAKLKIDSDNAVRDMKNGVLKFKKDAQRSIDERKRQLQAASDEEAQRKREEEVKAAEVKAKLVAEQEVEDVRSNYGKKSALVAAFDYARVKREMMRMEDELRTDEGREELKWAIERMTRLESLRAYLVGDVRRNGVVKNAYRLPSGATYEIRGVSPDGKSFVTSGPKKDVPITEFTMNDWVTIIIALLRDRPPTRQIVSVMDHGDNLFNAAIFCYVHGDGDEKALDLARNLAEKALALRSALSTDAGKLLPIAPFNEVEN
ncbi:MAG: protein kinase, partial [Kiritimatiellaeota bacterium]|nr:protein kinase [Kiritimatiellota bacterium]